MTIIRKSIAAVVATALSLTLFLVAGPASANPGIDGGLTTCIDLDENGIPQCDYPDDEPEEEEDPELPPADVDDVVVADPTFTG